MNKLLKEIVYCLLVNNIHIELSISSEGILQYTIHTGAKSNLTLFSLEGEDEEIVHYYGRYEYLKGEVNSFNEILYVLRECRCGRDYIGEDLAELLVKEGVLTKTIKTVVEYK